MVAYCDVGGLTTCSDQCIVQPNIAMIHLIHHYLVTWFHYSRQFYFKYVLPSLTVWMYIYIWMWVGNLERCHWNRQLPPITEATTCRYGDETTGELCQHTRGSQVGMEECDYKLMQRKWESIFNVHFYSTWSFYSMMLVVWHGQWNIWLPNIQVHSARIREGLYPTLYIHSFYIPSLFW